jgi:hypothetical protein
MATRSSCLVIGNIVVLWFAWVRWVQRVVVVDFSRPHTEPACTAQAEPSVSVRLPKKSSISFTFVTDVLTAQDFCLQQSEAKTGYESCVCQQFRAVRVFHMEIRVKFSSFISFMAITEHSNLFQGLRVVKKLPNWKDKDWHSIVRVL